MFAGQLAGLLLVMRLNKTLANRTIALRETEITGLAARAMKLLGLFDRDAVALNFAVIGIFAPAPRTRTRARDAHSLWPRRLLRAAFINR